MVLSCRYSIIIITIFFISDTKFRKYPRVIWRSYREVCSIKMVNNEVTQTDFQINFFLNYKNAQKRTTNRNIFWFSYQNLNLIYFFFQCNKSLILLVVLVKYWRSFNRNKIYIVVTVEVCTLKKKTSTRGGKYCLYRFWAQTKKFIQLFFPSVFFLSI